MYDVIIIGAGPAGVCCARKLAEKGLSVKVFDKRQEIGSPKRCGEGLDEKTQDIIGKIPDKCIAQRIKGARVYAPNGKYLEAIMSYGGFVLERKVFDKWMAEQAVKAGAKVQADTLIKDFVKEDGYFVGVRGEFLGEEFEERAKVVVCATGAESSLRKHALGVHSKPELVDTCIQYEMSGIEADQDYIHIYMSNEAAPRGYVWIFPKGDGRANVGVGIAPGEKTPKYYLDKFIDANPQIKKGSIIEVNAGCVPVGGMLENMVANGLLMCGEAAHHVNPIHGGGIKEAILSGILAADVISEAIAKGDVSEKALSKFNVLWWEQRGGHMKRVENLREVVEKLSDNDLNDLLTALRPDDIIEFCRGGKLGVLAKILMKKPKLMILAKKLI